MHEQHVIPLRTHPRSQTRPQCSHPPASACPPSWGNFERCCVPGMLMFDNLESRQDFCSHNQLVCHSETPHTTLLCLTIKSAHQVVQRRITQHDREKLIQNRSKGTSEL
eukprot:594024-Amphidinium_carterae.2